MGFTLRSGLKAIVRRRVLECAALAFISLFAIANYSQPTPEADSGSRPFKKCWEFPSNIVAEAGIAADNSQGYFVDAEGRLLAVDLKNGQVNWTTEFGGQPVSELALSKDAVIIASRAAGAESATKAVSLRSYAKSTGLVLWQANLADAVRHRIDVAQHGILHLVESGEVQLINESTGRSVWKYSTPTALSADSGIYGGRIVLAADSRELQELSLADGKLTWAAKLKTLARNVIATESGRAVIADEKGGVFSVSERGDQRWAFRAGGKVIYLKAVGDNVLIGSIDNFVYFMSADSGDLLWKRRLPGRVASGGLIGDKRAAFTVVGDNSAFVLDLDDGRLIDKLVLGNEEAFLLTPIRANGIYLLAGTSKGITAFSAACGDEKSGVATPLP